MDVTPKTLRDVVFREKLRGGYHPDDVDEFLEQVAAGLEVLHDRLRQAVERAQRAEAAAAAATNGAPSEANAGDTEASVKTLVLAQRTADMHVREAREKASQLVANAEHQAQSILSSAEERSKRNEEETLASTRAELIKLETTRAQAQQEVEGLNRWIEEHKAHLTSTLKDALGVVERAGTLSPPPVSQPIDIGRPDTPATEAAPPPATQDATDDGRSQSAPSEGPETALLAPGHDAGYSDTTVVSGRPGPSGPERQMSDAAVKAKAVDGGQPAAAGLDGPDPADQALDEFFDDPEFADERRFGGRLRRRR